MEGRVKKVALSRVFLFDASCTCIYSQNHGCSLCRRLSGEGANDWAVQEGLVEAGLRCYIDSEIPLDALAKLTGWVAPCLNPLII